MITTKARVIVINAQWRIQFPINLFVSLLGAIVRSQSCSKRTDVAQQVDMGLIDVFRVKLSEIANRVRIIVTDYCYCIARGKQYNFDVNLISYSTKY